MKAFRKPRAVLLAFVCLLSLVAMRPAEKHTKSRPVLIVGTDHAPPYYFLAPDGSVVGVAVDVLRQAAAHLDFDVRFVHFAGVPDTFLRSRQADLWPVMATTPERLKEFHISKPWLFNTFCLLHLRDHKIPDGASLRLANWSNPVTTHQAAVFFPLSRHLVLGSREDVMRSVCSGESDAGMIETRVLDSLLLTRPSGCESAILARQSIPGAAFPMSIGSVKDKGFYGDELESQIAKMAYSGELSSIFEKWSSVNANEVNSILAMNAAQERSRLTYFGGAIVLLGAGIIVMHTLRVRKAFGLAHHEGTERKRAEEAHRNADRVRNLVLEGAGEGICGLDAQGRTTFLNSMAARMLGLESGSPEGQDFHLLVHGPDLRQCLRLGCSLNKGQVEELRADIGNFNRPDGTSFPVEFICSPLFDDGQHVGSVVSFSDVTARRQAESLDRDRNRVLEMLAENRSLDQIFEAIARLVEQQYPGFLCAITAIAENRLELRAGPSLPEPLKKTFNLVEMSPAANSLGIGGCSLKPVVVTDISTDLAWEPHRDQARAAGVSSCWTYPIVSGSNQVLGTVSLLGVVPGKPEIAHQVLLQVACRLARLAIEQTRLNRQLHHQAHHDSLTGLPNRLLFEERLLESLKMAESNGTTCVLFYIDLDRFKQINDTLSHRVGDLYLRKVAQRLQDVLPESAMLARLGGDEFAIVFSSLEETPHAETLARELLQAMATPFLLDGFTLFGTASIGIGLSSPGRTAAQLQSCADQAMYRAKSQGRNRYQFYSSEMSRHAVAQLEIEHSLREALKTEKFVLYYQPQCHANGDLFGLEALIRLRHPERGLIAPSDFIAIAEETGLIVPIGSWVLGEACRQLAAWRAEGRESFTVAINVSASQISQGNFAEEVAAMISRHNLPASALEIELTESMIMSNFTKCLDQIVLLRELGVKLSIDDFGTGYSSLSHLHRLPVHTIKIDQSFVRAMDAPVSTRPLVEAIIAAAHSLKCNVIAEGVETETQRKDLAKMGCDRMQGFLFSRPQPAEEVFEQFQRLLLAS